MLLQKMHEVRTSQANYWRPGGMEPNNYAVLCVTLCHTGSFQLLEMMENFNYARR